MQKIFFLFLLSFYCESTLQGQDFKRYQTLGISAGRSFNGSGDLRGLIYSTDYSSYFSKNKSFGVSLSGTIHDDIYPVSYNYMGEAYDASIRNVIAGVQLVPNIGYSILKSKRHEIKTQLGLVLRYQSSSVADISTITYPPAIDYPIPVVDFVHFENMRSFAIGGQAQLKYNYRLCQQFMMGIIAGFQTDSEGNNLTQLGLSGNYRF